MSLINVRVFATPQDHPQAKSGETFPTFVHDFTPSLARSGSLKLGFCLSIYRKPYPGEIYTFAGIDVISRFGVTSDLNGEKLGNAWTGQEERGAHGAAPLPLLCSQ